MQGRKRVAASLAYILGKAQTVIDQVEPAVLERFLEALASAQRVFVYGTGRSGLVARAFAVRLAHLGYSTYVIGETITAPVQARDLVVLVSGSGQTYPVAMTAEIARTIGAQVAVLTMHKDSKVARDADIVLELLPSGLDEPERQHLAPLGTLFETTAWLLLDGVVSDLMLRRQQDEESMRRRHATLE